ncbi:MAG: hypothetical protein GF344_01240, partial [Chitinivibrionales bacterium]|nr:hypothetical protein [Chitinivibrionales bacterium]MBD3355723.1 hypothetical protein [Chitinivibrionales bacterium]
MVRYKLEEVSEGMVLAESVFTPRGDLLLAGGYKICNQHLERFRSLGLDSVFIDVEGTERVTPESVIS